MFNLTIIIPIYNVEKYILDCIQSVITQLTDDIEVICVDDGSTDHSINVLCTYLKQQPQTHINNIKILQQQNAGVAAARNLGIAHAQGKYLTFLDSDDVLMPYYAKEVQAALVSDSDVISFGYQNLSEDLTPSKHQFIPRLVQSPCSEHNQQQALFELFNANRWFSGIHLYKATLFQGIQFPKLSHYEDAATIPDVIIKAKSFYAISRPLYGYRIRSGSATNSTQPHNINRSLQCLEQLIPTLIEKTKRHAIFIIPLMHFFYIYMYQSTKFKNKQIAKSNWNKFSGSIQQLSCSVTWIQNEHNRILYHCLNLGLYGFYLSKLMSRLLRSIKKRLGRSCYS
ncbi:glycosyltransferase family 2 protein [Acinetobacter sp. A3]|uniref:glycosyltransferase family 2 protein n=1 Tax=Acinetobacter sp. A3 TaxID=2725492 RepID=UPI0014453220|nr:glycosyltransferase family 2 protein [Acinetobacter sp. A3]